MKRRGILAAAGAVVAGIAMQRTAQSVMAAPIAGDSSVAITPGVTGTNTATTGVTIGVLGQTTSTTDRATGVYGYASADSGGVYGVLADNNSATLNASGVKGNAFSGVTNGVW